MHPEFEVHKLNEGGIERARDIARVFDNALSQLTALVPPGRHFAIARTKLEEACFFAKKAMACEEANQERG